MESLDLNRSWLERERTPPIRAAARDSDAESAVTDVGDDADLEYEVDAIKYAVWKDSRDTRDDGKVGWHYGVMWKGYLKTYSDTEEFISQFSSAPGQPSLVKEFWTAVMQDPEYASELSMKKGKREPAIPHSVKGTNQPFVVETPRDLMRQWLKETKPRRRMATWIRRREKEKAGLPIPKTDSDYYVRKRRIAAKLASRNGRGSVAPSAVSGDESDDAPALSTAVLSAAGPSQQRQPSLTKKRPKEATSQHRATPLADDSDGEVEASLGTIRETDETVDIEPSQPADKGKGKAKEPARPVKIHRATSPSSSSTSPRKRQRESLVGLGVSVSDLFADEAPKAGPSSQSKSNSTGSSAPALKKPKISASTVAAGTSQMPRARPAVVNRLAGLSKIKKRQAMPPDDGAAGVSSSDPPYNPKEPLFLASPSPPMRLGSPEQERFSVPQIDRVATPSFGEPMAGIFDSAPTIPSAQPGPTAAGDKAAIPDPNMHKSRLAKLASWLTSGSSSSSGGSKQAEPVGTAESTVATTAAALPAAAPEAASDPATATTISATSPTIANLPDEVEEEVEQSEQVPLADGQGDATALDAPDARSMVPAEEPAEEPVKETAKEPAEESAKEPVKKPVKETAKEPSKEPVQELVMKPVRETAKDPAEATAEEPAKETAEEPAKYPAKDHTARVSTNLERPTSSTEPAPLRPAAPIATGLTQTAASTSASAKDAGKPTAVSQPSAAAGSSQVVDNTSPKGTAGKMPPVPRKGLPDAAALADLPKYQEPKGILKLQGHTHIDPEVAKALKRKGLPIPQSAPPGSSSTTSGPGAGASSSAGGRTPQGGAFGGQSPAATRGDITPLHPSMQSFSAIGPGSTAATGRQTLPAATPAARQTNTACDPRPQGVRPTGTNNIPLGQSTNRYARPGPDLPAPSSKSPPRQPKAMADHTAQATGSAGACATAGSPRRAFLGASGSSTAPGDAISPGHLSPVQQNTEPALPVRRTFGAYNPALDPRRRHMFGSGPGETAPSSSSTQPAVPAATASPSMADTAASPPPPPPSTTLPPPPPPPLPPPSASEERALSPSIGTAPLPKFQKVVMPSPYAAPVPPAKAHFSLRADLAELVFEIQFHRGAEPMSNRNRTDKQPAPVGKPGLSSTTAYENLVSILQRDLGGKMRDLHMEMVEAYCLEGQARCGAKVLEWVKISPRQPRPEWDTVKSKMLDGKIFAAYVDSAAPTIECHYAIVFIAVQHVEKLDVVLPAWSSAEVGFTALLVALPLDSPVPPLMPNPVRPILHMASPTKPTLLIDGAQPVLDAYGITDTFLSSLRGKIAIFRYSHPSGSLDRLYSAVIDGFRSFGVKGLTPSDTVPPNVLILSNARLSGAVRSHTLREAVQRRTAIMALGPSLSLLPYQWKLRPVWSSGGLVTFSPTFILRSPDKFAEIMKTIRVSHNWAAYIIPSMIEWAEASWKEPQRCIEPEKAFETLTRNLFLDHQLLQFSGSAASSGGGLAVSMAPPSPHLPLACMRWMEWLRGLNEETDFRGLVDRCQGVRIGRFEREALSPAGTGPTKDSKDDNKQDKLGGASTGPVMGLNETDELLQVDIEQAQLEDLAAMRSRPDLLPYRRYLYIGEMSLDQKTRDRLGSSVELVRPDDFVAIFSGAV